ncbi:MAG: hypothetical protein QOC81_4853 [Thermoanaerobaculia bacterium]|jgi:hypothetical protein|nr:hypothetical protein [Thermoanaerobaculia bacterium]
MIRLSIRVSDKLLECHLRAVARRENVSLSKAALILMRKGAGLTVPGEFSPIGTALDRFIGSWTEENEREILTSIADCETVDQSLWT